MARKSYLQDILDQPVNLRFALNNFPTTVVEPILKRLRAREFKKIILTGHGSSFNSLYPAFIKLSNQSVPVAIWQTAELLHYGINQIDSNTLLCINSQSGQSAEVKSLLEEIKKNPPGCLLALTNDMESVLGENSDILVQLNAGEEYGVASKTYLNALSLALILAAQVCEENADDVLESLLSACSMMEIYLEDYQAILDEIDQLLGNNQRIIVVGRGPSMATALNGALNQKEAAWMFTEGMNAAEFRHGPLELADSDLTLIILEGDKKTVGLNLALGEEVLEYGSSVIWIGNHPASSFKSLQIPDVEEIALPLAELLPIQLIAQVLSTRKKLEAGKFRRIGKVVLKE